MNSSWASTYKKAANEKVVLFTGGSAAWGVGATATDRTVAGRMQYYLNTLQSGQRYTVINVAMGSWIAFQQFIGLQQWGSQFDPDGIVSMDGFNDAGVGCNYSQGPGNPMYFATMRSYIDGYLMSTLHPVFYRGWLENELILTQQGLPHHHRQAIRSRRSDIRSVECRNCAGPTANNPDESGRGAANAGLLSRRGAGHAECCFRRRATFCPRSRWSIRLPATSTTSMTIRSALRSARPRSKSGPRTSKAISPQYENEMCGQGTAHPANTYILDNGALQLEQLVDQEAARGRAVEYYNIGTLFPDISAGAHALFHRHRRICPTRAWT